MTAYIASTHSCVSSGSMSSCMQFSYANTVTLWRRVKWFKKIKRKIKGIGADGRRALLKMPENTREFRQRGNAFEAAPGMLPIGWQLRACPYLVCCKV